MKKNIGKIDRQLRILFGFAVIGIGFVFQSWWGVIGLVPVVTGMVKRCPAYAIFGINTCGLLGVKDACRAGESG